MNFLGAFHSSKTSALNVRQLPVANGTAFSKISKQEVNFARYSQIFEKFFSGGFLAIPLNSWNFENFRLNSSHFGNSTVPGIYGNFSGKFLYHLPLFPIFRKFNGKRPERALFIQPKISEISVRNQMERFRFGPTGIFGTTFAPLQVVHLPVGSFWSVGPECPFPFDKIVVPSTALFHPAYKAKDLQKQ